MSVSNQGDYVSGAEVATEIERLNDEIGTLRDDIEEAKALAKDGELEDPETLPFLENALDDLKEELKPLEELDDDVFFTLSDVTLISDDYFEDAMQRWAIDAGEVSESSSVFSYIDWERYAGAVQCDYTSVDFDGETFWYRS